MDYKIGDIVDVIIDKNGKEWHVKKVDENAYAFVETMEVAYSKTPMEDFAKWLDENLTEEQKKKWRFTK